MAENNINQRIEDFKRTELETLLNQCTDPQREMFEIGYPDGVPESKLITAIQLCERTVAKNDRKRKEMK